MSSLNSYCPMLGSEIDIYTHANKDLSITISNFTLRSKVVGIHQHGLGQADWLLAWTSSTTALSAKYAHPTYSYIGSSVVNSSSFSPDVDMYLYYCWVTGNIEIAGVHVQTPMKGAPANLTNITVNGMLATLPQIKVALLSGDDVIGNPATNTIREAPCPNRTCGKMNDVGVHKCWNCEGKL